MFGRRVIYVSVGQCEAGFLKQDDFLPPLEQLMILIVILVMDNKTKLSASGQATAALAGVLQRNIKELVKLREQEEKEKTSDERIADKITSFTGSMSFVYIHMAVLILWVIYNLGLLGLKPIDPSFTGLMILASV